MIREDKTTFLYPNTEMDPYPVERIQVEQKRNKSHLRILVMIPGSAIAHLSGVIVEVWDRVVPHMSRSGSKNRKYKEAFTEQERAIISRYHTKMYDWHLRSGHQDEIGMSLSTYQLLERAANFFATI